MNRIYLYFLNISNNKRHMNIVTWYPNDSHLFTDMMVEPPKHQKKSEETDIKYIEYYRYGNLKMEKDKITGTCKYYHPHSDEKMCNVRHPSSTQLRTFYGSAGEYIVVFKELFDTITDENRIMYGKEISQNNKLFARYHANKLLVTNIYHKSIMNSNENIVKIIQNTAVDEIFLTYIVGEIIDPGSIMSDHDSRTLFEKDPYRYAVTFYMIPDIARFSETEFLKTIKYTGKCTGYNDWFGYIEYEENYIDGKETGITKIYSQNNDHSCSYLSHIYTYVDGEKNGLQQIIYENGKIALEIYMKNNVKHGRYIEYDYDGTILVDGYYLYGEPIGIFKYKITEQLYDYEENNSYYECSGEFFDVNNTNITDDKLYVLKDMTSKVLKENIIKFYVSGIQFIF